MFSAVLQTIHLSYDVSLGLQNGCKESTFKATKHDPRFTKDDKRERERGGGENRISNIHVEGINVPCAQHTFILRRVFRQLGGELEKFEGIARLGCLL